MEIKDNKKRMISNAELLKIKRQIKRIHEKDNSEVPKFLDSLKNRFKIRAKEATSDNEFLKYM